METIEFICHAMIFKYNQTDHFSTSKTHNPSIGEFNVVQKTTIGGFGSVKMVKSFVEKAAIGVLESNGANESMPRFGLRPFKDLFFRIRSFYVFLLKYVDAI